jgi:hypothetical protein
MKNGEGKKRDELRNQIARFLVLADTQTLEKIIIVLSLANAFVEDAKAHGKGIPQTSVPQFLQ